MVKKAEVKKVSVRGLLVKACTKMLEKGQLTLATSHAEIIKVALKSVPVKDRDALNIFPSCVSQVKSQILGVKGRKPGRPTHEAVGIEKEAA